MKIEIPPLRAPTRLEISLLVFSAGIALASGSFAGLLIATGVSFTIVETIKAIAKVTKDTGN